MVDWRQCVLGYVCAYRVLYAYDPVHRDRAPDMEKVAREHRRDRGAGPPRREACEARQESVASGFDSALIVYEVVASSSCSSL